RRGPGGPVLDRDAEGAGRAVDVARAEARLAGAHERGGFAAGPDGAAGRVDDLDRVAPVAPAGELPQQPAQLAAGREAADGLHEALERRLLPRVLAAAVGVAAVEGAAEVGLVDDQVHARIERAHDALGEQVDAAVVPARARVGVDEAVRRDAALAVAPCDREPDVRRPVVL